MLIPSTEFIGLEGVSHLCAGGETPMLVSHRSAIEQFMHDKALGELGRVRQAEVVEETRQRCAALLSVDAPDISFLSSSSEGINVVAYGLDWKAGDNVVVADVEFPSGVYPWSRLAKQGVETRIARHQDWQIRLEAIDALIDDRTRVVLLSHVSMFTGQRVDLRALSELVRGKGARLVLDATHAAGVVPVDARLADVVVSSCYKWLLGTHGTAVFYWNRETFPELQVPFLGWKSAATSGGWRDPEQLELHDDAHRFMPGNPSFISVYILNNALERLMQIDQTKIEAHALSLTRRLYEGIEPLGLELMTPEAEADRAGNICVRSDRVDELANELKKRNVLVWGTYGVADRLRISTHVYNHEQDVDLCIEALSSIDHR